MTFTCVRCRNDFDEPGGLFFSTPSPFPGETPWVMVTKKFHLCEGCSTILEFVWTQEKAPIENENFWGDNALVVER